MSEQSPGEYLAELIAELIDARIRAVKNDDYLPESHAAVKDLGAALNEQIIEIVKGGFKVSLEEK